MDYLSGIPCFVIHAGNLNIVSNSASPVQSIDSAEQDRLQLIGKQVLGCLSEFCVVLGLDCGRTTSAQTEYVSEQGKENEIVLSSYVVRCDNTQLSHAVVFHNVEYGTTVSAFHVYELYAVLEIAVGEFELPIVILPNTKSLNQDSTRRNSTNALTSQQYHAVQVRSEQNNAVIIHGVFHSITKSELQHSQPQSVQPMNQQQAQDKPLPFVITIPAAMQFQGYSLCTMLGSHPAISFATVIVPDTRVENDEHIFGMHGMTQASNRLPLFFVQNTDFDVSTVTRCNIKPMEESIDHNANLQSPKKRKAMTEDYIKQVPLEQKVEVIQDDDEEEEEDDQEDSIITSNKLMKRQAAKLQEDADPTVLRFALNLNQLALHCGPGHALRKSNSAENQNFMVYNRQVLPSLPREFTMFECETKKVVECPVCSLEFAYDDMKALSLHVLSNHQKHLCVEPEYTYGYAEPLPSTSGGGRKAIFYVSPCFKMYKHMPDLSFHRAKHIHAYMCGSCLRSYTEQKYAKEHSRNCRLGIKCTLCNSVITSITSLRMHMRVEHNYNTEKTAEYITQLSEELTK